MHAKISKHLFKHSVASMPPIVDRIRELPVVSHPAQSVRWLATARSCKTIAVSHLLGRTTAAGTKQVPFGILCSSFRYDTLEDSGVETNEANHAIVRKPRSQRCVHHLCACSIRPAEIARQLEAQCHLFRS